MRVTAVLRKFGIDLRRIGTRGISFRLLEYDLPRIITKESPMIFDVGANKGQTIELLQRLLRTPRIVAFEPSEELASSLKSRFANSLVVVEQRALAAAAEVREFVDYENNELSSFLPLSRDAENPFHDTKERVRETVSSETVASYAMGHGIEQIDLLKIDTQGFDLEVLKGAEAMIVGKSVGGVLVELNFAPLYTDQCGPGQVIDWLCQRGFSLVGFYEEVRPSLVLSWATALFLPRTLQK